MKKYILPTFGLSVEAQGIIKHFSEVKKCPSNYVATSLFAAVGGIAGKRLEVVDGAWCNYGQLYTCLIGAPGSSKSPAMDIVMEPVGRKDYEYYLEYKRELKEWKIISKKDNTYEKPTLKKIAADDVTMEKLTAILSENDNGIILHCDELTDLTSNLNRYNNGDNMPKFIKMWSNGDLRVDRKGDDPLMIQRPFLSVLSSTQPVNLNRIFGKSMGTGFFSRWLFCLPDEEPQQREQPNLIYFDTWSKMVHNLVNMPPLNLTFSEEAQEALQSFDDVRKAMTDSLAESNPELAEYYIKQCYTIRRLSAIVHLLSYESNIINGRYSSCISLNELQYAEKLVEFYEKCAIEVLGMMADKRVEPMTDKRLLQEFNNRFHPTNISALARLIGKSEQYLSKVFLNKDTSKIEADERKQQSVGDEVRQYISVHCPRVLSVEGLPDDETVNAMMEAMGHNLEDVTNKLNRLENMENLQQAKGSIYGTLFATF